MLGGGSSIDSMNKSLKENARILKGRASFNARRSMYLKAYNSIQAKSGKPLSDEEKKIARQSVREKIKRRNRFNSIVLIFSILLGMVLVVAISLIAIAAL